MGPTQSVTRSESVVNNIINFIRALSPTERRTQFIAIAIFAGLSTVTAILLSCYKKFHHKATVLTSTEQISESSPADKVFKEANLIDLLRNEGGGGCAKAAEIVKLPAEILCARYPDFVEEIEMAHSLYLRSLFYKLVNTTDHRPTRDYIRNNVFAVNNEELQIRNEISKAFQQMLDIWGSNKAETAVRLAKDHYYCGMDHAKFFLERKLECFNFEGQASPFQEAIEIDPAKGEQNIFSWVNPASIEGVCDKNLQRAYGLNLEKIGKRVNFFSPGLLLLQDSKGRTVLSYLLIKFTKYLPELQSFDPQPHQSGDKGFLEEVLKNHPVLLEKFIFSDVYLNDVMPMILEFLNQKKYFASIANFLRLVEIVVTLNDRKSFESYQKCSDRISESLELLGTDQEVKGLKDLALCARFFTGTPKFLTPEERQMRRQKVQGDLWFPFCKLLRDNFFRIQEKFAKYKDLEQDYNDVSLAAYPRGKIPPTEDSFT